MATFSENQEQMMLDQERARLKDQQDLVIKLSDELSAVHAKEDAGNRILAEIAELAKGHPEDVGTADRQRVTAFLPRLAAKRAELELRIGNAKRGIDTIQGRIKSFDLPKLTRLQKIRDLFQQMAG